MTIHVALSGGIDSTSALARVILEEPDEKVWAWSFDYGQKHRSRELEAARKIADLLGVPYSQLGLPRLASPALTGKQPIPLGHYADESMKATIVQGRNLLIIATMTARAKEGDTLVIGVHAGDHAIYPDCRPAFIDPLRHALGAGYGITLHAPYLHMDKAAIIQDGTAHAAPLELTWSCYEGGKRHCGRCGTCYERQEAFQKAGIPDPTEYQDRLELIR